MCGFHVLLASSGALQKSRFLEHRVNRPPDSFRAREGDNPTTPASQRNESIPEFKDRTEESLSTLTPGFKLRTRRG